MQANSLPKEPALAEQDVISAVARWGSANNVELARSGAVEARRHDRYSLLECRVDATGR